MERSRKLSSREETVSQVRQRVSLVSVPSNSEWTKVLLGWQCFWESDELDCDGDEVEAEPEAEGEERNALDTDSG